LALVSHKLKNRLAKAGRKAENSAPAAASRAESIKMNQLPAPKNLRGGCHRKKTAVAPPDSPGVRVAPAAVRSRGLRMFPICP
jgi:hypothetical protein